MIIGINAWLFTTACGHVDDENIIQITMDLKFDNETDSTLIFKIRGPYYRLTPIVILPHEDGNMSYASEYDKYYPIPPSELHLQGLLNNIFEGGSPANIITLNDTLCVIHLEEKSVAATNYRPEIISRWHFRYTYTFTAEALKGATICK
ncbi:MAG: hypothetical protein ACOYXT_23825 [Bacteroidota bacterium]